MQTLYGVVMSLALAQPTTHLSIQPWTGTDLQTTSADAAKYRLEVTGQPNSDDSARGFQRGVRVARRVLHAEGLLAAAL